MYFFGSTVAQDAAKGMEYATRGCELGEGASCALAAGGCCVGRGAAVDARRAVQFADKGCVANDAKSCQLAASIRARPGDCQQQGEPATTSTPSGASPSTPSPAGAAAGGGTVTKTLNTAAGELRVVELEPMWRYAVTLAGKTIFTANMHDSNDPNMNGPTPTVYKKITPATAPFDEVIMFQQNGAGNACNGYGFWFLGLKKDGTFAVSKALPACGGPQPRVTATPARVTVFFPAAPPNRGTGIVPAETWVFENGDVKKR